MNLMTIKEVAEAVKVSVSTVRRWVRARQVPAYKVGSRGQLRFRLEDIEQYVAGQRVPDAGAHGTAQLSPKKEG